MAQEYENGLSIDSVDPQADAAVIAAMRARMDSIHVHQHRPTVGLVLSGGGAKGSAHVGVLKYLEELKIPIDMICGTSMGGLVGGITSMGYNAAYMDSLLRVQDWGLILSDRIDQKYYSYARKKYKETYLLSVPLKYSNKDFQTRVDEQLQFVDNGAQMGIGRNNLATSLPSGYAYGFNVQNLFSSISVGYEDEMSFMDLPIPFFCVAADMVTLKAKNWAEGSLKDAMRSTMSIPILFKPVRTGGMILVDGGTRNNFPVDLAKAMGCDIIIGVDLSDLDPSYSQVNNIADILMQFIAMLGRPTLNRNKADTDVFIKPKLEGFNMLSFSPGAIDTIIHRGYVAARVREKELKEVKRMVGDAVTTYNGPRAIDINHTPVRASAVEFLGVTNAESRMLQHRVGFRAGQFLTAEKMQRMMSIIQATGCFSSVKYSVLGSDEPYKLVFNCEKGPRHQFGAGVRFDSEEWASFIFNLGLNAYKLNGLKFDIDAKVSRNQRLGMHAALDVSWLPTLNVDARLENISSLLYTDLSSTGINCRWWGHRERAYISNVRWRSIDFAAGAQYRYYSLALNSEYGYAVNQDNPYLTNGGYAGLFANGTLYTQDRSFYPSKGIKLSFGYDYDFFKYGVPDFKPLHTAHLDFNAVLPMGRHLALIPDIHARALDGSTAMPVNQETDDPTYSLAHQNYIGGTIAGRYIDGQMPFIGFGNIYKADRYAAVANLSLRAKFGENVFVTATGGCFKEADTPQNFISSPMPNFWGGGAEFALITPIGPFRVLGTWSDRMHNFIQDIGIYVSLGFDF